MKKFIVVASMAVVSVAQAAGMYAGIGYGVATVDDSVSEFNAEMISLLGGRISSTQDKAVNNFRLFGGVKLNENVALEVGYLNTSKLGLTYSGASSTNTAYSGKATASYSGVDFAAVLRPSVASGYNGLFATFGVHNYKVKRVLSFNYAGSLNTTNESESGTGALVGFGYDWKIDKDLNFRLAVTRLDSVGGASEANTTNYSIGLLKNF